HHRVHWADGGPTDMGNLVSLCPAHHRLVHEGGWRIEGDPNGELIFIRLDGRRLSTGPPGLDPDLRNGSPAEGPTEKWRRRYRALLLEMLSPIARRFGLVVIVDANRCRVVESRTTGCQPEWRRS